MNTCIRYFFFVFVLLSKPACALYWVNQLLAPASGTNVVANYSGYPTTSIPVKVSGFSPASLSIVWRDCTNEALAGGWYDITYKDYWIFVPTSILIEGKNYPIKIASSPSGFVLQANKVNNHYVFFKQSSMIMDFVRGFQCNSSGAVTDSHAIFPEFTFSIEISNLQNKKYTGTLPIKFLQAKQLSLGNADSFRITATQAYSNATSAVNVNYTLDIRNKCSLSTNQLQLEHGTRSLNDANGHTVSQKFYISCLDSGRVSAKLSLEAITKPNSNISTNGVLVGLGSGWNSIVTVDGFDFSTSTPKEFTIDSKKDLIIKSQLQKTNDSTVGKLSGSALMKVSYD
ncbi:TPA: hypothetical protein J1460_004805 [Escherichia coli]|nr:hypothetical protein [Escherichia coli]